MGTPASWVMVVGVSGGVSSDLVSLDNSGQTWVSLTTPLNNNIFCVAYGGTKWVVGGLKNTNDISIIHSSDGIIWNESSGVQLTLCLSIAYGNGTWVAGGSSILFSPDSINWYNSGGTFGGGGGVYSLAYGNGLWVAGNTDQTMPLGWSPDDARTWYNASGTNFGGGGAYVLGIATDGSSNWVAVGNQGATSIQYSNDGKTWEDVSGTTFSSFGNSVAYGGGLWVAVGNNQILHSTNGKFWSSSNGNSPTWLGLSVAYSITTSTWIATGQDVSNPSVVYYSPDGFTWNSSGAQIIGLGRSIANIGPPASWVMLTTAGALYSIDGKIWNPTLGDTFGGAGSGSCVSYNGTRWLAGGASDINGEGSMITSSNGIIWSLVTSFTIIPATSLNAIAYGNNTWVVGHGDISGTIMSIKYSTDDGNSWMDANSQMNICKGVAYDGSGSWIAVGTLSGTPSAERSINGINWTPLGINFGTNAKGNEVTGVAYGNNVWIVYGVAGVSNVAPIQYSTNNGNTWNPTTGAFDGTCHSVTYSGGIWVATGVDTTGPNKKIIYSTTGISWSIASGANALISASVFTSNGIEWVGVGVTADSSNNTVQYSPNGIQWDTTYGSQINGALGYAIYAIPPPTTTTTTLPPPTSWVVATSSGLLYSSDGKAWNPAMGDTFIGGGGYSVAYNGNIWLAGGSGTKPLLSSTDGITWSYVNGFPSQSGNISGLAYGPNMWVASVRDTPELLYYSPDGTIWTEASGYNGNQVAYGKGTWVAVGSQNPSIAYSTNGMSWNTSSGGFTTMGGNGVAYGNNTWVAVGSGVHTILYSTDNGRSWTPATGALFNDQGTAVTYSVGVWVAVGVNTSNNNTIVYSTTGKVWYTVTGARTELLYAVASNGKEWITCGVPDTKGYALQYSTTGTDWNSTYGSQIVNVSANAIYAVPIPGLIPTSWVMNTSSGLLYSTDGQLWNTTTGASFGILPSVATSGGNVAYNGKKWVAVGISDGSGNNAMLSSLNGVSWSLSTGNIHSKFTSIRSIAYGNGIWVASGTNTNIAVRRIQYSSDGNIWNDATGVNILAFSIAYGGGKWIAVGEPEKTGGKGIVYSSDGIMWSTAIGSNFESGNAISVAYGNNMWVAVGNDSSGSGIKYSPTGIIWYDVSGGTPLIGTSVAYGKNMWVVVGTDPTLSTGMIQYSYNGMIWYTVFGNFFNTIGISVAYGEGNWIAGGVDSSGNTIAYSSNGINWNTTTGTQIGTEVYGITYRSFVRPPPCFVAGTRILTPAGYKLIETLQSGDNIRTSDGRHVPIRMYSFTVANATADTAPYTIAAGALGNNLPKRDLHLSPRHAIQDDRGQWQIPRYLVLHNPKVTQYGLGKSVTYYHVECPNFYNDNLVAEGAVVESYKNRQGTEGIVYIWESSLGGWQRILPENTKTVPKNLKKPMIFSY